jgi:hypothetical protein
VTTLAASTSPASPAANHGRRPRLRFQALVNRSGLPVRGGPRLAAAAPAPAASGQQSEAEAVDGLDIPRLTRCVPQLATQR